MNDKLRVIAHVVIENGEMIVRPVGKSTALDVSYLIEIDAELEKAREHRAFLDDIGA